MRNAEPLAFLATRIPKSLHRRVKLHCTKEDVPLAAFVLAAIRVKLHGRLGQWRRPSERRNASRRWLSGPARRRRPPG